MSTYLVTPEELYYLLSTFHGQQLVGLKDDPFTLYGVNNEERLLKGRQQLIADGFLVEGAHKGRFTLDPDLAFLSATLAAPQLVVLTQRRLASGKQHELIHYLAEGSRVEVNLSGNGRIRLAAVRERADVFQRLADMLKLPAGEADDHGDQDLEEPSGESLSQDELASAWQGDAAARARILSGSLSPQDAGVAPELEARIQLMRLHDGAVFQRLTAYFFRVGEQTSAAWPIEDSERYAIGLTDRRRLIENLKARLIRWFGTEDAP